MDKQADDAALAGWREQFLAAKRSLLNATEQFERILAWVEFGTASQDYIAALEAEVAELRARLEKLDAPY